MTEETRHVGELERLGPQGRDVMVLGVEAPEFENLSLESKTLAFYLYRAAIPGNRIAFQQCHRHALEIKTILEEVLRHSHGLDGPTREAVHDYLKYVWIHHGQYDHLTHAKFTPNALTPQMLRDACEDTIHAGARFPTEAGVPLGNMLARLEPHIFDADCEPLQTNQSEGHDIVATSAVNYWDPGVTAADLESLEPQWQSRINVRFAKRNGKIEPEVYRVGGLYSAELETISHFLRLAVPFSESAAQRESIKALREFYRTGDEDMFRRHMVHWLGANENVDYLNGFIEVYLDPRGAIGQFEGNVSVRAGRGLVERISVNALYFERRMPWPDKYKRNEVTPPVANVVSVLVETGDGGPVSPAAYNLPNYNDIRRDYGSKNVILHNVENTWSREQMRETVDEFFLPEYRENMMTYYRDLVRPLEVYMHEVIGHGSGLPDPALSGDPRAALGRVYSALEECRADLVALYHIADPKLLELGAFAREEQRDVIETSYISALQGWLARLDRVPGLEVREAHDKGHHAILNFILEGGVDSENDYGAEIRETDGDWFVRVTDIELMHAGIGDLLSRIQVIKSTGDGAAAQALFERFGTHINPAWKANIEARRSRLNTPKAKAFVFPRLVPVLQGNDIVDVEIRHDEDLTAQQLRFSRMELSRDITD